MGPRTAPIFWGGLRLTLLSRKPSKEIGVLSRNPPKKLKPHGATLDKALRLIEACLRENRDLAGGSSEANQSQAPQKPGNHAGPPWEGPVLDRDLSAKSQGISGGEFCGESLVSAPKKPEVARAPL